jgi:plasmid stabilization system protein ParE
MRFDMKYKVIVSEKVMDMLKEHILFFANVNKSSAHKTKKQLIDSYKSLENMPQRNPFFNSPYIPSNKYHKMFVDNWYLVLYQLKDDTVYIDYIVDCRQDYQWLL